MYAAKDDRFPETEQVPPPIGANGGTSGRFLRPGVIFSRAWGARIAGSLWVSSALFASHRFAPHRLIACAFLVSLLLHAALLLPYPFASFGIGMHRAVTTEKSRPVELRLQRQQAAPTVSSANSANPDPRAAELQVATPRGLEHEPLPMVAARFFDADTLDKRPRAITERIPGEEIFSLIAPSGAMRLRLWIDERGEVVHVAVERGDLPPNFGQQLAAAFREIRFEPGERDGRPVGSILKVEVSYTESRRSAS